MPLTSVSGLPSGDIEPSPTGPSGAIASPPNIFSASDQPVQSAEALPPRSSLRGLDWQSRTVTTDECRWAAPGAVRVAAAGRGFRRSRAGASTCSTSAPHDSGTDRSCPATHRCRGAVRLDWRDRRAAAARAIQRDGPPRSARDLGPTQPSHRSPEIVGPCLFQHAQLCRCWHANDRRGRQ